MKTFRLLLLSLTLFVVSTNIDARPLILNFDSIYANADFCDRVEIINHDIGLNLLSVKSYSDSLTYTFHIENHKANTFLNSKDEYLLIRGKPS